MKILTGDNELVAAKVCRDVGLAAEHLLRGSEIEQMDDEQLAQAAARTTVFAKLTPLHKERIVKLLRRQGTWWALWATASTTRRRCARPISASPSIRRWTSPGSGGHHPAGKSLMVLEQGVIEGRRTFANMLKYIKMTASSFGNVFSVLIASAFLPFLPMLPLHLLIQNLMYDISQIAIPFDNVDDDQITQPQRWNSADLGRFMVFFGPISSIFDVLTFSLMWWVFKGQYAGNADAVPVRLVRGRAAVANADRAHDPHAQNSVYPEPPVPPLCIMTLAVIATGIGCVLAAGRLPAAAGAAARLLPWLVLILAGYMVLTQCVKGWFVRRYGWQ